MYKHRHHLRTSNHNRERERQRREEMETMRKIELQEAIQKKIMMGRQYAGFANKARMLDHRGYRPSREMNAMTFNHNYRDTEQHRRQEINMEMTRELAFEEAFKEKMMESAEYEYADTGNKTKIQCMRTACERIFSKLNHQLGKLIVQIKETDFYADIMNMEFNGRLNELNHSFGADFAAYSLENEKRNIETGFTSKKNKKKFADLQYQTAGHNNSLRLRKLKRFEDIDMIGGISSNKKKSNNPILNYVQNKHKKKMAFYT